MEKIKGPDRFIPILGLCVCVFVCVCVWGGGGHSSINIYSLRSPKSLDIPLVNRNIYAKFG